MGRKRLTGLPPVLATAAFLVMPAVAQATPYWYSDGVKLPEGKTYPTLSWGTLMIFLSEKTPAWSCENVAIGDVENPTGGGAGEGETDQFATTDCAWSECPEEDGVELQAHAEGLPWPNVLVESGTQNRVETNGGGVEWGCYAAHTNELERPPWYCHGSSDPLFEDGSPGQFTESKLTFTGESDKLECEDEETKFEQITEKQLHVMTYGSVPAKKVNIETSNAKAAETLEVKDP